MAVTRRHASRVLLALASASALLLACEQQTEEVKLGQTSSAISKPPEMGCTMQRFEDHEYWFCPTARTADDANTRCNAQPWMHLARIDSQAEQTFINTYATTSAWIGGQDKQTEGQWRWTDNGDQYWQGVANGSAVGGRFTRWASGQPDDDPITMPPTAVTTALWNPGTIPNPTGTCTIAGFGDSAYWTCTSPLDWSAARSRCTAVGADLVSITTAAESSFVNNIATGATAWNIGLQRSSPTATPPNTFRWLDGGNPFAFQNWLSGEPNTSTNNCGVIENDLWRDWTCATSTTRQFICEDTTTMPIPDAQGPHPVDLMTAQRRFTGSTAALTNGVNVSGLGCSIAAASTDAVFTFNLATDTRVLLDLTSSTFSTGVVALFRGTLDSAGYVAAGSRCAPRSTGGSTVEIQADLSAGAYYAVITSTSGTGSYDITFNSDPAADCARTSGGTWADDACNATTAQHRYVCESDVSDCTIGADGDDDGVPDCFDECPLDSSHIVEGDCGCPSDPEMAGTTCNDGLCAMNTACDGAGNCGSREACAPDTSCTYETFGTSGYYFCDNLRTASEARAQCAMTPGMHLVHVNSAEENAFLVDRVEDATWIGATDGTIEGDWRWPDDNTQFWSGALSGAPVASRFNAWRKARAPDDVDGLGWPTADCAALEPELPSSTQPAAWSDYACHDQRQRFPFTCEVALGFDCPLATDIDSDGTLDCYDTCPQDPERVEPGDCGCSDAAAPMGTSCDDGVCPGVQQCNGMGQCGNPASCAPAASCMPRRYQGKVYWVCPGSYSWTSARDMCRTRTGVDLVRIDDQAENDFVRSLSSTAMWIGANDRTVETDWRWVARPSDDGPQFWEGSNSTRVNGLFSKWGTGEPGAEDCAQIIAAGTWQDALCTTATFGAVCETALDNCALDPIKLEPGLCGCGIADVDSDNDGTPDCLDGCPSNGSKLQPLFCGCAAAETDSDNDGTPNCVDACPNDGNKVTDGLCGCGVAETDGDRDGIPNCQDGCPNDVHKTTAGVCGCGMPELDSDDDGAADCMDGCPNDAEKLAAGACGCGVADVDSDGDRTIDCFDQCPRDPSKVVRGDCGCNDGSAAPAGTPCDDGLCAANNTCNGQGRCGTITQCAPEPNCTHQAANGSLYFFCPTARTWDQARTECSGSSFDMLRVNDAHENAYLLARGDHIWLGAQDLSEGTWTWRDGTTFWSGGPMGSPVGGNYANWSGDEPNDLYGSVVEPLPVSTPTQLWDSEIAAAVPPAGTCTGHIHNSRAYWICTNTQNWNNARTACTNAGGDLASMTTQAEDAFVAPLTSGSIYHAGLQRQNLAGGGSGVWQWLDGTLITTWNHWGLAEPLGSSTCAAMDGAWRTISCSSLQRSVCERGTPPLFVPDLDSPQSVDVYGTNRFFAGNTARTQNVVDGTLMAGCGAGAPAPDAVFTFTITQRTTLWIELAGSTANTRIGLFRSAISATGFADAGSRCTSNVNVKLEATLDPGTYYAVITGEGSASKKYVVKFWGYRDGTPNADCAALDPVDAGGWHDTSCADTLPYACEVPVDECPNDGAKLTPGVCGCGRAETDADGDGTADCIDGCPGDPFKLEPGDCGCGDDPAPIGTSCGDGFCLANNTCDGEGRCGDPMDCAPEANCIFDAYAGSTSRGYFFCPAERTWQQAQALCENVPRGQLARIDDQFETLWVGDRIFEYPEAWIGANDLGTEDAWYWRDYGDLTGEQFWQGDYAGYGVGGLYTNWAEDEPNDFLGEDCGSIYPDGLWNDEVCDWGYPYVCEIGDDLCPDDPRKWEPGACGCGKPDSDTDGDGVLDCVDTCPFEAARSLPAHGHCAFTHAGNEVDDAIGGPPSHAGAADGSGNVLIVMQANVGNHTEVHARRLSALGTLLDWSPIVLDANISLGFAAEPRVAGLPSGGWAVTWTAEHGDAESSAIAYRVVSAAGVASTRGIANRVMSSPDDESFFQRGARVVATGDGFVIAWTTEAFPGDAGSGLRARLFSRAGQPRGTPFFIAATRDGDQTGVELAASGTEWMAVWEDLSNAELRARRFVAAGPVSDEEIIATNAHSPAVSAMAGDGNFGIAWINASFQTYAARSQVGLPLDTPVRVLTGTRVEVAPSIAPWGDALAVGFSYAGYEDGNFAIFDPLNLETTPPQEAAIRALLLGISKQTQVAVIGTPTGVWVTWTDDAMDFYDGAHQLAAHFIPAP